MHLSLYPVQRSYGKSVEALGDAQLCTCDVQSGAAYVLFETRVSCQVTGLRMLTAVLAFFSPFSLPPFSVCWPSLRCH